MKPDPFSPDMLDFLRLLDKHDVQYLLIADVENGARLFEALLEFWGGQIPHVESVEELVRPGMVFQFGVKPNQIDLLSRVDGLDFDEAWSRRVVEHIEGLDLPVSIIALEDLRRTKAAAGRLKDLDDLENLPVR